MIIIGAGSLGIQICDQLLFQDYKREEIIFFDEKETILKNIHGKFSSILGFDQLKDYLKINNKCFIAVGHPIKRMKLAKKIISMGGEIQSIKANTSQISNFSKIGNGYFIQAGVSIVHNVSIGEMPVIHANSIIAHDVNIGNFLSLSPNVSIMKNVNIGDYCFIGTNVTITEGVNIGNRVYIKRNSIVNSDLSDYMTF